VKKDKKKSLLLSNITTLLISILAGFVITYFFVQDFRKVIESIVPMILYSAFIGLVLWKGNKFVSDFFFKKVDLSQKPESKFIAGIIIILIYTFIAIIFVNFTWHMLWLGGKISEFKMPPFQLFAILMGVTFIISFGFNLKQFIIEKKEDLIKEEKLKTEIMKLEYEALKNQVNPHFLFNSLNALTSLVANNDEAVRFIKNLADVYRYVLEQKDKELVGLDRELEFVSAYLYLHQIRFGKNLEINICKEPANKLVAPLAVQMLVENAIKHNEISEDAPLKIAVFVEDNFLVIENNLQLKSLVRDSSKIGLGNIKSRYEYLTDIKVIAGINKDKFVVKLPLLEMVK